MTAIDARAYLEKSIDNVEDLPDDLAWTNAEVLEMLTEAVGLFEQAHTPTDDEREAIIDALLDELGWEWDEVPEEHIPSSRAILGDMADRVLAVSAGFRRPVQGSENSAQNSDDEREALLAELVAWQKHTGDTALANLLGRTAAALRRRPAQGEPTDEQIHDAMEAQRTVTISGEIKDSRTDAIAAQVADDEIRRQP